MRGTTSPGIDPKRLCRSLYLPHLIAKVAAFDKVWDNVRDKVWKSPLIDHQLGCRANFPMRGARPQCRHLPNVEFSRSRQLGFSGATLVRHHVEKAPARQAEGHAVPVAVEPRAEGLFPAFRAAAGR